MRWQVPADLRRRPTVGEWTPAAVLLGWGVWDAMRSDTVTGPRPLLAVGLAVAAGALVVRRRAPMTVLVVAGLAVLAPALAGASVQSAAPVLILVVALFSVGRYGRRPRSYLGLPLGMAVALVGSASDPHETLASSWGWSLNAVWIFGIGLWLNDADRRVDATVRRAEADRRAAAAEERLRVARDLHDVLAHSLSMMVVQAEVADELLDAEPGKAREALQHVQETGRAALRETRGVLGMLRGEGGTPAGLDHLPELVGLFRSAGLPVTLVRDDAVHLTPGADEAVYRVVQEALTNALRHAGPETTRVLVSRSGDSLQVRVENEVGQSVPVAPGRSGDGGHGLVGMRERIEAIGGRLTAGPGPHGGFAVEATLPGAVVAP